MMSGIALFNIGKFAGCRYHVGNGIAQCARSIVLCIIICIVVVGFDLHFNAICATRLHRTSFMEILRRQICGILANVPCGKSHLFQHLFKLIGGSDLFLS